MNLSAERGDLPRDQLPPDGAAEDIKSGDGLHIAYKICERTDEDETTTSGAAVASRARTELERDATNDDLGNEDLRQDPPHRRRQEPTSKRRRMEGRSESNNTAQ